MNKILHIYNRGVDKRNIFQEDKDRIRLVLDLFEFNSTETSEKNTKRRIEDIDEENIKKERKGSPLVNILAFCLMPNHFHLMLQEIKKDGIQKFMQKIGIAYTMYFNIKYERSGSLFQGTYKSAEVKKDAHLLHLPYYIHLNPLDLKFPEWRNGGVENPRKAMEYLSGYRWSSHLDYIGTPNFPLVTNRKFLMDFFNGPDKYEKEITNWLQNPNANEIQSLYSKMSKI